MAALESTPTLEATHMPDQDTGWFKYTQIAYDQNGKPYPAWVRFVRINGKEGLFASDKGLGVKARNADFKKFVEGFQD